MNQIAPLPATPLAQLEAWLDDAETEIFVSMATSNSPIAVTYRGILKRKPNGYFYLKAADVLSPVRGIAINITMGHPEVLMRFEDDLEGDRYISVTGKSVDGNAYRFVIADKDGFAHPNAI